MKRLQLQSWQPQVTKKTVIVISAECIYKFVTNLMVFIKGLLIQLFLSFDAENLINQLFNPNFFTLPFPPLFLWLCHFHKGFWLYLRRNWISGICQDVSVFFVLFLLPTAAKPDEWGDFSYFSDIRDVFRFSNPGVLAVIWWAQSAPSGWNRVNSVPKFRGC